MSKKMVEFVVLPGVDLTTGEEVTIAHIEEQGTKTALAIIENGSNQVAYAKIASAGLSRNDSICGDELFKLIPTEKLSGFSGRIVESIGSGHFIVAVDMSQFKKEQNTPLSRTTFEVKVAGSIRSYQAKGAVIKSFRNGGKTKVTLTPNADEDTGVGLSFGGMLTNKRGDDVLAGAIRPSSPEELAELKELIDALGEVEGRVIEASDSSYTLAIAVDQSIMSAVAAGEPIPDVENVKERLVNEGIKSEEVIDDVVEMLQHYGVDTNTIIEVLETYKAYEDDYAALIPEKPTTEFIDEGFYVFDSLAYILEGTRKGLRFVGPKGTGKNLLEEWVAYLLQRPLFDQPITIDTDKYELLGSKTADVFIDENGNGTTKIVFDPENLIKAMECGGIINMDEVNMASASVMALMNPVLDRRSYIDVSGYGRVVADENFMVFATMNENYAGTQELNGATQDRFATLIFDANDSILPILNSHEDTVDADQSDKESANQLFEGMSRMIKGQDLSKDAETIRGFIAAVSIAKRIGIRRGLIQNVVNNINDEDTRQQVRDFIDTII